MKFFNLGNSKSLATDIPEKSIKDLYPNAKRISGQEYLKRQLDCDYDPEIAAVEEFLSNI